MSDRLLLLRPKMSDRLLLLRLLLLRLLLLRLPLLRLPLIRLPLIRLLLLRLPLIKPRTTRAQALNKTHQVRYCEAF